jgi:osmotically-inducible protein OsmY
MANDNRYRGSDYSNYGNQDEGRNRYGRRDYNESDNNNSGNDGNRRSRRYDEDWDDYNNRMSNYGNRSQGNNYGSNYGNSYGTSQYNRDYDNNRYGNSGSSYGNSGSSGYGYGGSSYNSGKNYGSGTSYGNSGAGNYGYGMEYNRNRAYDEDYNEDYGTGSYGYGRRSDRDRDYNKQNRGGRDWWDKTKDEVSSWFGDEDAERRRKMDRVINHRGRGPKGYTRSDERIREDVNDRLSDDAFLDASEIEVTVSSGEVTLTGTVENRIDKRRAEDLAEDISGVKNVQNQLRVKQTTTTAANGLKNEYQG